jgi:TRAP-type C4-dicarboxylate transport system substrate-binding protein
MQKKAILSFTAAAAAAFSFGAQAQEVTIRVHHFLPPPSTAHAKFMQPWCDKLTKESGGKLKCQIFPGMQAGGTPPQLYTQVQDGVMDVVWTLPGYTPGRFPAAEVFELPFMIHRAEGASRALWDYAVQNKLLETEFKDVKMLAMHTHDQGYLHTVNKPVRTLADFKGMKLRAPTRLTNKMLAAFGATPVGMPVPQVPEALSKGVIDGAVVPWEVVPAIKVHELVKFHTVTDLKSRALYTSVFTYAMNKAKYDGLPPDLKKVIDANSGAALSHQAGRIWDEVTPATRKPAEERNNTIYMLPSDEHRKWEQAAQPVYDEWVKEVSAKGLNGQALLKSARELIQKYSN